MRRPLNGFILAGLFAVALYAVVAETVFAFRHPWATETQRLLHWHDAMMFRRIECPYEAK